MERPQVRLVDTGGIEPNTDNQILAFMREQAQIAIDNANVIIFVTDIKTGMTAADQEVAGMLQRSKKPIVLAVNKMDSTGAWTRTSMSSTIWVWATPSPCPPSTATAPATCWMPACNTFPPEDEEEEDSDVIQVAIIGKPNVASPPSPTAFWASSGSSSATWPAPHGTPSTAT